MDWIVTIITIFQYVFYGIGLLFSLAFFLFIFTSDQLKKIIEIKKYKNSLNQDEIYDFVVNQPTCKK